MPRFRVSAHRQMRETRRSAAISRVVAGNSSAALPGVRFGSAVPRLLAWGYRVGSGWRLDQFDRRANRQRHTAKHHENTEERMNCQGQQPGNQRRVAGQQHDQTDHLLAAHTHRHQSGASLQFGKNADRRTVLTIVPFSVFISAHFHACFRAPVISKGNFEYPTADIGPAEIESIYGCDQASLCSQSTFFFLRIRYS